MSNVGEGVLTIPVALFTAVIIVFTIFIVKYINRKETPEKVKRDKSTKSKDVHKQKPEKQPKTKDPSRNASKQAAHPHLLTTLKGHKNSLTGGDFSPSGKYFLTAAKDRSVMIWNTKDFGKKIKVSSTCNVQYDNALHICWSPDSKAVIVFLEIANHIQVYKVSKKPNGTLGCLQKAVSFPQVNLNDIIICMGASSNGKYIMTCDSENHVFLWDLRGTILEKFDTRHGETYSVTLSPCGRFLVTTGFTPDAKVYEVRFKKSGSYEGVKRIYELKGHTAGIYNCTINCDSSKMATISRDGTWRLFNTNVEYDKGQDPYFLLSGKYEKQDYVPIIAMSADGRTIAISNGLDLTLYSTNNGVELYTISNIYLDRIIQVKFDPSSKYVLTFGESYVKVFHNVAGYQNTIEDLIQSRTSASSSGMRERIDAQIKEAKGTLASILTELEI